MIPFNIPPYVEKSMEYIKDACANKHKICGDGTYTALVNKWFTEKLGAKKVLLTTSCSHALDMMAMLAGIEKDDEVIIPSYNFVSGANSVALRGGKCVFVDIRPDTMNIDEKKIEAAITDKTKAINVVHYAGVSVDMDAVMEIAKKYGLLVFEDAAQGMMSEYKGKALGTIGDMGAYSFHETKNYSMGEGGLLIINNEKYIEKAEMIREKGTDRSKFWRGEVDKYTWQEVGSSFLPSEMNAAYLLGQLEVAEDINNARLDIWNAYYEGLKPLEEKGYIELPTVPEGCVHNAHMFYLKLKDIDERQKFIEHMKNNDIYTVFHYIPLHSSPAGKRLCRFAGEDEYTTKESERLVRLPLYYGLTGSETEYIIKHTKEFFK